MTAPVPLASIRACLQGVIPSPLATCAADGTPNATYLSIVQYVDSERVATSRQFFNKTRANLDANPLAQVVVVDPITQQQYALDLRWLRTETEGDVFESMRANLEAFSAHVAAASVFRLRGVDIFAVERCAVFGREPEPASPAPVRDPLELLDRYVRRVTLCVGYEETTRVALEALDDVFGFGHSILFAVEPESAGLLAVASSGYPVSAVGAEVEAGTGIIGTALARRRVITQANLARSRTMAAAVAGSATPDPRSVPLPGLAGAHSAAAVPLVVGDVVLGVLYLESQQSGAFGGPVEGLLRIIGGHLAAGLAARGALGGEEPEPPREPNDRASGAGAPIAVVYYQADDSVLCTGEYIVKGVPGRILRRLLLEHGASGRTQFSNRELRLDESLGLPPGNDNLEARLLVLRRRLDERACGITLQRTGRGQLELGVERPVSFTEVATTGVMQAAHQQH